MARKSTKKRSDKGKVSIAKIKAEYISGEISLRALSEKYGIPEGKLFRHSKKEAWRIKREEYRSKVTEEAIASARTRAIEDFNDVIEMSKTLAGEVRLALGDPKQLYRRIVADSDGKLCERDDFTKIDSKAVKDLAGALEKLASVISIERKDDNDITVVMNEETKRYSV